MNIFLAVTFVYGIVAVAIPSHCEFLVLAMLMMATTTTTDVMMMMMMMIMEAMIMTISDRSEELHDAYGVQFRQDCFLVVIF